MQDGFQICLDWEKKRNQRTKRKKIIQVKFGDFSVTSYYNSNQSVDGNITTITMSPDDTGFLPEQFSFVGDETAAYRVKVVDKNGNEIPYKVRNSENQAPGLAGVTDSDGNVTMLTDNVSSGSTSTDFIIKQGESYRIEPNDLQDEFTVTFEKITVNEGTLVTTNVSSAQVSEPAEYANGYRPMVEEIEGVEQVQLSVKEKNDYFEDGVLTKKEPVQKPSDNDSEQTDNQETDEGKDNSEQDGAEKNNTETNNKEEDSQTGNEVIDNKNSDSEEYVYEDSIQAGEFTVNTENLASKTEIDGNKTTVTLKDDWAAAETFEFVGSDTAAYKFKVLDKDGNEIAYELVDSDGKVVPVAGVLKDDVLTMLAGGGENNKEISAILQEGKTYQIVPKRGYMNNDSEFTVVIEKVDVNEGTLVNTNIASNRISNSASYDDGKRPSVDEMSSVENFETVVVEEQKIKDYVSNGNTVIEPTKEVDYIIKAGDFLVDTEFYGYETKVDGNQTSFTLTNDSMIPESFMFTGDEKGAYKFKLLDKDGNEVAFELVDENGQILPLAAIKNADGDLVMLSEGGAGNKEIGVVIDGEGQYRLIPKGGYNQDLSGFTVVIEKVEITEGELVNTDIASNRISNSVSFDDGKKPTGDEMPSVDGIEDVEVESEENIKDFVEDGKNELDPTEQDLGLLDRFNQFWENLFNKNDKEDDQENNQEDNSNTGDNSGTEEKTDEELTEEQKGILETYVMNPVEQTICELMLAIGDFIIKILNDIVGEEVTITALVYNQIDAVNPNFFDDSVSGSGITANIKVLIEKWYDVLKLIAISIYVLGLLAISLQILLASTGNGMSKAKSLLLEWFKAICYLVFIPYLIKYAFMLNDAIVEMLREEGGTSEYKLGTTFGNPDEWSVEEIEYRSPEYVSRFTGTLAFGSEEATEGYVKKIPDYEQNLDLMRLMRAYAGATLKFVYAIIWYILLGQLIVFIVQYYKRYFIIAFLIVMFPLVCIFYGVSIARGKKGSEMGNWMRELFSNIFIQTVHAIIYTIITGICISVVKADAGSSATINWIIIIVAINFVAEGEKILKKILGAMGNSASGVDSTAQGIKGLYQSGKKNIKTALTGKE